MSDAHTTVDPTTRPLSGKHAFDGDDPCWAVAATQPVIRSNDVPAKPRLVEHGPSAEFAPPVPNSIREAGLRDNQVEALVARFLLNCGNASGREIADQVALPFGCMEKLLYRMKFDQIVTIKGEAPFNDYSYELAPVGIERARRYAQHSTYFGAAPVPLDKYSESVIQQSVRNQKTSIEAVRRGFADMVLSDDVVMSMAEAINLGLGTLLYGEPGNGKSTVAERMVAAYSPTIWIPRAISAGGEIVRLFDPIHHREKPFSNGETQPFDQRWVRIERPTIKVGGELQITHFDITTNPTTQISEAPLHLKSNCGVMVVDDFGRNRFRPEELLNRLIVPLERLCDTLHLPSGRTFQVPVHGIHVFSTNLEPKDILDEAFLRRLPYKIHLGDPSEEQFHQLFQLIASQWNMEYTTEDVEYLLEQHYRKAGRKLRFCHPRDILQHIRNACEIRRRPPQVSRKRIDTAVSTYFAV